MTSYMPADSGTSEAWAGLLSYQLGIVTAAQALEHGITRQAVWSRLKSGRWQRVHRGVFATFSGPLPWASLLAAAVLRAGRGATASHATAAYVHGFSGNRSDLLHLTIPAERRVTSTIDGVRLHYAHRLPQSRHPARWPPVTKVEDTVLDLVDIATTAREVARWVTSACQHRCTAPVRLADALGRRKKIRWRPLLESMLLDVEAGAQSPLELQHLRAVERAHRLPRGARQRRVAGARVIWIDVDYDAYDTRVELDGRVGHTMDGAFRDRHRDNHATVDGRATLRYGHAEIFGEPCGVAAQQAQVLRDRGWNGWPRPCGPDCAIS